jgi:putative photosynthetic complex assembly protein
MNAAHHDHSPKVPRAMLQAAGLLIALTITSVAAYRIAGLPPAASPVNERAATQVAPIKTRDLRFIDRSDGAVRIEDVSQSATVAVLERGSLSGFIRGTMRGLARDRMKHGMGPDAPFRLTAWSNGNLSLTDQATGRTIELSSFGDSNRASFAALLK